MATKKTKIPENSTFLIATDILQKMFEDDDKQAIKVMKMMKVIKDKGGKLSSKTTMSAFLRAIYMLDPETPVKNIQKVMSFTEILPTIGDFKSEKAVIEDTLMVAKIFGGKKDRS